MFPRGELTILAARKEILRLRIAARRAQIQACALRVTRPLGWIDHMLERWRSISPLVRMIVMPAGLFGVRALTTRLGKGKWLLMAPLIRLAVKAAWGFAGARK